MDLLCGYFAIQQLQAFIAHIMLHVQSTEVFMASLQSFLFKTYARIINTIPENIPENFCKINNDILSIYINGKNQKCSCYNYGLGTYPSPAARTCSYQSVLPVLNPWSKTGLETLGTRFHEPCQINMKPLGSQFDMSPSQHLCRCPK